MNKVFLDSIYQQLLELEGLVLLLKERNDTTSNDIKLLLINKSAQLLEQIDKLNLDGTAEVEEFICDDFQQETKYCVNDACDDSQTTIISEKYDNNHEYSQSLEPPRTSHDDDKADTIEENNIMESDVEFSSNNNNGLALIFTINDKYRFRRELFGNNSSDFADTLNLISAMNTYAEAKEYIIDDLNWDVSSDEVADFMAIIESYFKSRNNVR